MRVLLATDCWPGDDGRAGLDSWTVGTALARAWADLGDEIAVIPVGAAGAGFAGCLGRLAQVLGTGTEHPVALSPDVGRSPGMIRTDPDPWKASSAPLADCLTQLMPTQPASRRPTVLELADVPWRDGGRGMATALGLAGSTGSRPALLPDTLVTTAEEVQRPLTGLRGLVSVEGREEGMDPARMLGLDQRLCDWAAELTGDADAGTVPGTGAAGGVGLVISALGGQITTGSRYLLDLAGAATTISSADLVVTGCRDLTMMSLDQEVVSTLTMMAGQAGVPVIAVTLTNTLPARQLRESGLEAALPIGPEGELPGSGGAVTAAELTRRAAPVARTWHW